MAGFNPFRYRFPYTNINDINLDWIIKKVKALSEAVASIDISRMDEIAEQAETAQQDAETALATAQSAETTANSVQGIANNALTTAQSAETTANSVQGIANNALSTAQSAQTTATQAASDAQTANNNALSAISIGDYATTVARQAQSAADNAVETIATYVRPNLLDNWYFVGGGSQRIDISGCFPINQRGQTYYSNQGYTIDRWYLNGSDQRITIPNTNDTIVIATNSELCQKIENGYGNLVGKTVTLSVITATSLIEVTGVVASSGESVSKSSEGKKIYIDSGNGNQNYITVVIKNIDSGGQIKAVKLELGSEQTLAHQKNGAWVLNEIPDYGQELAKCQRYLEADLFSINTWPVANTFDILIPYKVTKARTPTFTGSISYYGSSGWESVSTIIEAPPESPLFGVRAYSPSNTAPANSIYRVEITASAEL